MKPRITLNTNEDGELEIWLNPTGRDLLVRQLQGLSEASEHFHFGPEDLDGEVPVQGLSYREGDQIIEWGKVLFRLDEWDAAHFPHVLGSSRGNGS
ncbi:hypothetical protein [Sphingomonas montana]|uniref:hypothetical protein n=1 Tax=Sphingomonas montana TaxID=1843236 RepID=UPI00096C95EF|nr:hypothetical protein [Sphingomonas montana]